jgi:DNA-binding MarR family transcriptional regulator
LARELAEHGFTAPQAAVLLALAGSDGPATMSSVAERLGMDRPTLTGITGRLERNGWLTVRAHPSDGRSRLLQLTPQAESALPALRRASARVSGDALQDLNGQERARLLDLLERVACALETDDPGEARS